MELKIVFYAQWTNIKSHKVSASHSKVFRHSGQKHFGSDHALHPCQIELKIPFWAFPSVVEKYKHTISNREGSMYTWNAAHDSLNMTEKLEFQSHADLRQLLFKEEVYFKRHGP